MRRKVESRMAHDDRPPLLLLLDRNSTTARLTPSCGARTQPIPYEPCTSRPHYHAAIPLKEYILQHAELKPAPIMCDGHKNRLSC